MPKVIEVTGCQTCPYKTEYNKCGHPAAHEHRDEHKLLPTDGSIADFCCLHDKDDYLESEFDIDQDFDDNPKDGPTMPPPFMFNDQAENEGWIIACESEGRTKAFYFIDTDSVDFPDKTVALKYVVKQALRMPKGIHAEALIYLSKHSPEYISTTVKETVGEIAFAELKEVLRYTEFDKIQF